jgi:PAS domain S-box-containing protein
MNVHEIFEAIGLLVIGLLFYSYARGVFQRQPHSRRRWQSPVLGVGFGILSVILMRAGIQLEPGVFIDARNAPIALIGLFEGWPAALIAAAITAAARLWLGGAGAWAGVVSIALIAVCAGLVHGWARREGAVGPTHVLCLAALAALALLPALAMLGARGMQIFSRIWASYATLIILSVGVMARLFHDVREQQRLMEDQERFRAIIDEAAAVVRVVDAETLQILETNRAEIELSGYSREEIIGKTIRDFWPEGPVGRPEREAMLADAFKQGRMHALNLGYRTRAGDIIPVDITYRFVDYRGRRFIIALLTDARPRLQAESALREAAELRAAHLTVGAAAHEINNPLSIVMGSLQLMLERFPEGSQEQRWTSAAFKAGERIRDAVARLSNLVRITSAEPSGSLAPILDTVRSSEPEKTGIPAPSPIPPR